MLPIAVKDSTTKAASDYHGFDLPPAQFPTGCFFAAGGRAGFCSAARTSSTKDHSLDQQMSAACRLLPSATWVAGVLRFIIPSILSLLQKQPADKLPTPPVEGVCMPASNVFRGNDYAWRSNGAKSDDADFIIGKDAEEG